VTILDVGHGNCCIITDGTTTILIDAGPGSAVLEYLRQEGINCVDSIILSHADSDHIKGANALLGERQFDVREIIANSDAVKDSAEWSNLAWDIDMRRRNGMLRSEAQLREGDILATQVSGAELTVLAPRAALALTGPGSRDPSGRLITTNSISAVILVSSGARRVALLTGDLDEVGFDHLLDTGQDLHAEILVFPHHGGRAGGGGLRITEQFATRLTAAVQPQVVIFSLDRRRYGTPRPEIIAGVRRAAPGAHIACTQLSTLCAPELPSDPPSHLLPLFARGRQRNACCAGTMRIRLNYNDFLEPASAAHMSFVQQFATTALCIRHIFNKNTPGTP
jgi:competence protein ComEC